MTLTPTERPKSGLARAFGWKPRRYLEVGVVAVTCGAIYFAGQSVYSEWSLSVRLVLALSLVVLSAVSGSLRLRSRVRGQRWSSTHPITLTRTFPEPDASADRRLDPASPGVSGHRLDVG